MADANSNPPGPTLPDEQPVRFASLPAGDLPLLIEPVSPGVDLAVWAAANRELLAGKLRHHGGILFRGFDLGGPDELPR
jgi:hypothetical protein